MPRETEAFCMDGFFQLYPKTAFSRFVWFFSFPNLNLQTGYMHLPFYKTIAFITFLLSFQVSLAQTYLAFDKPGMIKRVRFYKGDKISLKTAEMKNFMGGEIQSVDPPYVVFDELTKVHVDSVTHLRIDKNKGFDKFRSITSYVLIVSSIGLTGIDMFNSAIDGDRAIDSNLLAVTVPMLAVGLLIRPWGKRTHAIRNNKRLFIIDMDKDLNNNSDE
jgi:hypothetical protein